MSIPSVPTNHKNYIIAKHLQALELGSSVAESDTLLETARVETSAFGDLLNDRVDLVPGTKGSGKSALFRIFVDFLPDHLLKQRKVVVAHGIQSPGDPVFHAFTDQFEKLSEEEFVSFWCIYLVSLSHEHFLKGERYADLLRNAPNEVDAFRRACQSARIPEIQAKKSLRDVLDWVLLVLKSWKPKVTYKPKEGPGDIQLDLFGGAIPPLERSESEEAAEQDPLPRYVNAINEALERIVEKATVSLWLMVDRLDEVFPRRSDLERRALRGLLRAMRFFSTKHIRVKVFLRDDMLDQVVRSKDGFTALTHITARQADTLRWTEEQILCMVVRRIFANQDVADYLRVDRERLNANAEYRLECFYRVFPPQVHRSAKQSSTLSWMYKRCSDGRGVVTPRDVLDLLMRAKQKQQDDCAANGDGTSTSMIGSSALQYGLEELSKRKRQTYLEAEFPHLWKHIEKFVGGKTEYDERSIQKILGKDWKATADDLVSIGLFAKKQTRDNTPVYWVPFLYRDGLDLTQGRA
jgi:hypothetical protein